MAKLRHRKWIDDTAPDGRTDKVAARTLKGRLDMVAHYLLLAARKADRDTEYVHNLRVWVRRATVALDLYGDLLPPRRAMWMRKQLKRVRRAAGAARDYDVLAQMLEQDPAAKSLKACFKRVGHLRSQAQEPLAKLRKHLRHDRRFERRMKALLQKIHARRGTRNVFFGTWAHARLRPIVKAFFDVAPGKDSDMAALHQFRIRGKELRYAMELLAGAFPPEFRHKLYPQIETLQDRLGRLNDLVIAQERLRQMLKDAVDAADKSQLLHLIAQIQIRCEHARHDFLEWCTPQFLATLQADFNALLQPKLAHVTGRPVPVEQAEPIDTGHFTP